MQRITVFEFHRNDQGAIQFLQRGAFERADIMSKSGFRKAYQFIAVYTRLSFQSLGCAYRNLGTKAVIPGVDGSANESGESGID